MIGPYLKEERLKTDITQAQLSRVLKCKPQQVCNIERGVCNVPLPLLKDWIRTIGLNKKSVVDMMLKQYKEEIGRWL